MRKFGGPVYIQHNPLAADGLQAFIDFVNAFTGANPQLHVDIKRVIAECDLVVTHSHITKTPPDLGRRSPTSSGSTGAARSSSTGTSSRRCRRRPPTTTRCSEP